MTTPCHVTKESARRNALRRLYRRGELEAGGWQLDTPWATIDALYAEGLVSLHTRSGGGRRRVVFVSITSAGVAALGVEP